MYSYVGCQRPIFSNGLLKLLKQLGAGSHSWAREVSITPGNFPLCIDFYSQTSPSKERHLVQLSYKLMALSPLRDGERIMGAGSPRGARGFGEFQPGLESVPFSFLIHPKLNIYEHASLKMGNSAAHSVSFSLVGNAKY